MWVGAHLYVNEDLDHYQPLLEVPEGLEMSRIQMQIGGLDHTDLPRFAFLGMFASAG